MKLLCLGDSLTEGYEINVDVRWTNLLQEDLSTEIVNCGISGDTTTGMLARCERLLLKHQPTHIIIFGGTNDLWFGLKDEFILSNIHAMRRQSKYHNIESIVGIPTPSVNLNELNIKKSFKYSILETRKTNINNSFEYLVDNVKMNEFILSLIREEKINNFLK